MENTRDDEVIYSIFLPFSLMCQPFRCLGKTALNVTYTTTTYKKIAEVSWKFHISLSNVHTNKT